MGAAVPQRLSMDEITTLIEEVAKTGEGADKFRALKFLAVQESAGVSMPPPLTADERIARMARLVKAMGMDETRLAISRAFPRAVPRPLRAKLEHLPQKTRSLIASILSVPDLYRKVPALKRGGAPGYPAGSGTIAKRQWAQAEATRYFLDELNLMEAAPEEAPEAPEAMAAPETAPEITTAG